MKMFAKEEGILSQPRKYLITSFTLQNGTLITPLLLFYLQPGLVITRLHSFLKLLQIKVSTASHNELWTPEEKVTRIKTPV